MFDYLIAVGVACVGLAVMYFIFSSISNAEIVVASRTAADRKPRPKKQARGPSQRYKEDVLDKETEQLIADEVARTPSGLSKDTRVVEPPTLEAVRARNQDSRKSAQAAAGKDGAISERQRLIDKELGFQSVGKKQKKEKKEKSAEKQWDAADEEDMDRKLANFFRSTKGRNRQNKINLEEEAPTTSATPGGRIAIKGDLTGARTWEKKE